MSSSSSGVDLIASLIAFAAVAILFPIWSSASCHARWEGSGLTTDWGLIQGCVVILKDGRRLPEDRVREIDLGGTTR